MLIAHLLVPWTENHLSNFKCGFLNILSPQNLLRSLSRLFFLLRWNKYGAKKCLKNHIPFDFWDDSTLANQGAGKTIEKPLKELPWNQQRKYCYCLITLNGSVPKISLKREYIVCHWFKAIIKWSLKSLVFNNLFELIRTQWNSGAHQSKQNQNGKISKAVTVTFKIHRT